MITLTPRVTRRWIVRNKNNSRNADDAILSDICIHPTKSYGERVAKLKVSYGNLSDVARMECTAFTEPGEEPEDGWERPENCQGNGCKCESGGSGRPTIALVGYLLLFGLTIIRRRLWVALPTSTIARLFESGRT